MKKKLPISLVMVIYNEDRVLERALKSAADLVDEIIIIHDGKCLDKSLRIARAYTKEIHILNHDGYCDSHRAEGISMVKNEWVLLLDADEYLSNELRKNLEDLICKNVDIYEFSWPVKFKNKLHYSMYKSALFKKSKVYFIGAIHEYVKPLNKHSMAKKVDLRLMHEPIIENFSISFFFKKNLKWAVLQANQLVSDFTELKTWNYNSKGWDYPNNVRISHPIIFGVIASPLYHFATSVIESINKRDSFFVRRGLLMSAYFICLYTRVAYLKLFNNNYDKAN